MLKNLVSTGWQDYELIDSGEGRKLEKYGKFILDRPEGQALWKKNLSAEWQKADAYLVKKEEAKSNWKFNSQIPQQIPLQYKNLQFTARLTPFGHTGIFPEQSTQWDFIQEKISSSNKKTKVLSLFSYTGLATVAATAAGGEVTHVDASKPVVTWAHDNLKATKAEDSVRWIVDDALKFVNREVRRGNKYDAIVMDPPKFGRGPHKELWKFEDSFLPFLNACRQLLSDNPRFIIITTYAVPVSAITLETVMSEMMKKYNGNIEAGEMCLQDRSERLLPTAIYSRWFSS